MGRDNCSEERSKERRSEGVKEQRMARQPPYSSLLGFFAPSLLFLVILVVKPISQYRLHQQMIGGLRHPDAYPEVEFPVPAEIDVHRGQNLLLLIAYRVEAG